LPDLLPGVVGAAVSLEPLRENRSERVWRRKW
jgi:hypothetical protein